MDVAAGLAYSGKVPFATRALEMVRTHLCYDEANVKLMAAYAGLSDSFDGPTHHAIIDIAIMRSLPHMTVVVPGDTVAVDRLLPQMAAWQGPVYFRLNRNEVPVIFDESYAPEIGKAVRLRAGADVTLICNGMLVTAEEHSIIGGLGSAVAKVVTGAHPVPVRRVGIADRFAETGPYHAILERYGMDVSHIVAAAKAAVAAK